MGKVVVGERAIQNAVKIAQKEVFILHSDEALDKIQEQESPEYLNVDEIMAKTTKRHVAVDIRTHEILDEIDNREDLEKSEKTKDRDYTILDREHNIPDVVLFHEHNLLRDKAKKENEKHDRISCSECHMEKYTDCCPEDNECPRDTVLRRELSGALPKVLSYLRNSKDLPPDIRELVDRKFWDLV